MSLEILYSGAAGHTSSALTDPFTAESLVWGASLTKLLTSTCLMRLVSTSDLALDTDVRGLIPELASVQILRGFEHDVPTLEENHKPITLKMLLTHTLGLGTDVTDPDLARWSKAVGRTDGYLDHTRKGVDVPLKFSPGEGWYYGGATDWAGLVLEKVAGESLGSYMSRDVFGPLGMKSTGFDAGEIGAARVPVSTRGADGGIELGGIGPPESRGFDSGGSGIFSTAGDYARFLQGVLRRTLLSESTTQEMLRPQLDETQRAMLEYIAYNLGIQDAFAPEFPKGLPISHSLCGVVNLEDSPGKRRAGSNMWSGMGNSRWWIDPETGVAAVLVMSLQPQGDGAVVRLWDRLERAVYKAGVDSRPDI